MDTASTEDTRRHRVRGPYATGKAKREAIIDGAIEVFSETGYTAGSLRAIAEKAGISQPSIFHYFADKAELFLAVLERRDKWAQEVAFGDGESGLLRGIIRLAEALETMPGTVQLYVIVASEATALDHPAHERFREDRERYRQAVTACLDRLAADGLYLGAAPTAQAAASIIALLDGIQMQWLLDHDSVGIAATMRSFIGTLVHLDEI
ncbi:TetR/AcrR family transcriptional regulator [Diaminobutyricibacter sp. McL0618]|uniref:TetR/AcrR family transcriptional regulator n=1 Tax=Leifsonia sp. McL0618 TaxID=3415677 RepID=UPI003CEDD4D9